MFLKLFLIFVILAKSGYSDPIFKRLTPLVPSETYTHSDHVDDDNKDQYVLFWKLLPDDEIQFEVHCNTTGWVGLGISANGGMKDSDIAIGWYDQTKNQAFLQDCHAKQNGAPQIDPEQNWNLLDGAEVDGYTILKYKRKLYTCDKDNDREIKTGTTYMIFAFNKQDPSCSEFNWQYHDNNRWTKSILLMSYKEDDIDHQNYLPADTFKIGMRMRDVKIESKSTYYYCDFYKLPEIEEKLHLVQFEMIVNKTNQKLVHHLLAYECTDGYIPPYSSGMECGDVNLPNDVAENCQAKLIIAWGIGGQYNYSFPKEAGYPLELNGKTKYLMIEMHYDNPNYFKDRYDDSGVDLYVTHTHREHDLGLMWLGVDGSPWSIQLPAQSSNIVLETFCHPDCTEKFIPEDGINIVSSLLHTHFAGQSVKTTLVRNGSVIKNVFENPNYDFNYQYLLDIEPVKVYKGDALITQCVFDTTDRQHFTKFGFASQQEMCYSFVYYYPRIPAFERCFSPINIYEIIRFYKKLMLESLIPTINIDIGSPYYTMFQILAALEKTNSSAKLSQRFKEFYDSDYNADIICGSIEDPSNLFIKESLRYEPEGNSIVEKQCDATTYESINCKQQTQSTQDNSQTTMTTWNSNSNSAISYNKFMKVPFIISLIVFLFL